MKTNKVLSTWSDLDIEVKHKKVPFPLIPKWKSDQEISWAEMFAIPGIPFELNLESLLIKETLIEVLYLASPENKAVIRAIISSKDLVSLQNKICPINIQQFEQRTQGKRVDTEMFGMFWSYLFQKRYLRNKTATEIAAFVQIFFISNGSEFSEIRRHISKDAGFDENNQFIKAFVTILKRKSRGF